MRRSTILTFSLVAAILTLLTYLHHNWWSLPPFSEMRRLRQDISMQLLEGITLFLLAGSASLYIGPWFRALLRINPKPIAALCTLIVSMLMFCLIQGEMVHAALTREVTEHTVIIQGILLAVLVVSGLLTGLLADPTNETVSVSKTLPST